MHGCVAASAALPPSPDRARRRSLARASGQRARAVPATRCGGVPRVAARARSGGGPGPEPAAGSWRSCRTSCARRSRRSTSAPRCCAAAGPDLGAGAERGRRGGRGGGGAPLPARRGPARRRPPRRRRGATARRARCSLQHWLPAVIDAEVHAEPTAARPAPRSRPTCRRSSPTTRRSPRSCATCSRNAVRYAADGMPVEVVARPPDRRHDLTLEVLDRGPGVAGRRGRPLFEPFYRSEAAEAFGSGAGLGPRRRPLAAAGDGRHDRGRCRATAAGRASCVRCRSRARTRRPSRLRSARRRPTTRSSASCALRVQPELADRLGGRLRLQRAAADEAGDRGRRDVRRVDPEVGPQGLAGVAPAVAVGAEHDVRLPRPAADQVRQRA